ncbi:MAG: thymidine phosphorylase [Dethiobacter sp.]|jgi:pyrimidine-nucleoside phosphorylase|nr:thymidine phosphorylase [Dethiobacter sp.]
MRAVDIIQKKRDGISLSAEEINFFINGLQNGETADYQAAAWLMAVYFSGMDAAETAALTMALADSGEKIDLSAAGRKVVDKHSTGGVGDKTTLVLLPLVAAAGAATAKLSGRGLGHTGGTIDKLSCIPGFRTDLSREEFINQVAESGLAVMAQSPGLTPADGMLYALRDVTATVDSIPLIASSVMSKKIASGANAIVLDVKAGSGAFMKERENAVLLAKTMVAIGESLNRRTIALITAMDQPLGHTVGNHLEVIEAFETLKGQGPADLVELCLQLGAEMLLAAGVEREYEAAYVRLSQKLSDGSALEAMRQWIVRQGGDAGVVDEPQKLGVPHPARELLASTDGYILGLDAGMVGRASVLLGAGRSKKGDEIDLMAGIRLNKKTGDMVRKGDLLAEVYTGSGEAAAGALVYLADAYTYSTVPPLLTPLIYERVDRNSL